MSPEFHRAEDQLLHHVRSAAAVLTVAGVSYAVTISEMCVRWFASDAVLAALVWFRWAGLLTGIVAFTLAVALSRASREWPQATRPRKLLKGSVAWSRVALLVALVNWLVVLVCRELARMALSPYFDLK
jgi:hypothetical protein